jgi:hypothetical protein
MDPEIEKLLRLQDKDVELIRAMKELKGIPVERHRIKVEIEQQEVEIENARQRLMGLEVERKEIENEVGRLEDQVNKYKSQQLEVKKNEEYQALTHEIEENNRKIGELEDREIRLMLEIDEESQNFKESRKAFDQKIESLNERIDKLNQREGNLNDALLKLEKVVEGLRKEPSQPFLEAYDNAKSNLKGRPPFVSPIVDGLCKRSNLKVSNEKLISAKEHGVPHYDDATGCLVYID